MKTATTRTAGTWNVPALYTDHAGAEVTQLSNDGQTLCMQLRGVDFVSDDFESFEPVKPLSPNSDFRTHHGALCGYSLSCAFGVWVLNRGVLEVGALHANIEVAAPEDRQPLRLKLSLVCSRGEYEGSGLSGFFELELQSIMAQLAHDLSLRCCLTCQFSDYSPYGQGLFGGLMCFESIKQEYLKVDSRQSFWAVHDRFDRHVQETYLCPAYHPRTPGTGYRG